MAHTTSDMLSAVFHVQAAHHAQTTSTEAQTALTCAVAAAGEAMEALQRLTTAHAAARCTPTDHTSSLHTSSTSSTCIEEDLPYPDAAARAWITALSSEAPTEGDGDDDPHSRAARVVWSRSSLACSFRATERQLRHSLEAAAGRIGEADRQLQRLHTAIQLVTKHLHREQMEYTWCQNLPLHVLKLLDLMTVYDPQSTAAWWWMGLEESLTQLTKEALAGMEHEAHITRLQQQRHRLLRELQPSAMHMWRGIQTDAGDIFRNHQQAPTTAPIHITASVFLTSPWICVAVLLCSCCSTSRDTPSSASHLQHLHANIVSQPLTGKLFGSC